jgi:hypothetical protein
VRLSSQKGLFIVGIGPIQLVYFKFDSVDKFTGEIRKEITSLRGQGLIRLIDVLFVAKAQDGTVTRESVTDMSEQGAKRFGSAIKKAMGLETPDVMSDEEALDLVGESLGLSATDLSRLESEIAPGEAGLVMMFEHSWAGPLRDAIRNAGGRTVLQAFLTPGAVAMVGGEVNAVLQAQETMEAAEQVRAAAMLDAMISIEGAEQIAQLSAARAMEARVAAAMIEDAALDEAEAALEMADIIKREALVDALEAVIGAEIVREAAIDHAVDAMLVADAAEQDAIDTVAAAEFIKTLAVAETLRVLIEAGDIQQAATAHAMNALAEAGLIQQATLAQAEQAAKAE